LKEETALGDGEEKRAEDRGPEAPDRVEVDVSDLLDRLCKARRESETLEGDVG